MLLHKLTHDLKAELIFQKVIIWGSLTFFQKITLTLSQKKTQQHSKILVDCMKTAALQIFNKGWGH